MEEGFAFYNKAMGTVPRHLNIVIGVHPVTKEMLVVNLTTGKEGKGEFFTHRDWDKVERPSQLAIKTARLITVMQMMELSNKYLIQETKSPKRSVLLEMRDQFFTHSIDSSLKAFLRECL